MFMAHTFKKEINKFYEIDGPLLGYEFYGDNPDISGFPFKPVITYEKGFARNQMTFKFDKLVISAIPLPAQPLDIKINNLSIQNTPTGQLYEIDEVLGIQFTFGKNA